MNRNNEMELLRDEFRNAANIIDELIDLEEKEKSGEDVTKECESIMGRFIMTFVKIDALAKKM